MTAAAPPPANIRVGQTEYTLCKVAEKDGDFWTPVGPKRGDPDYSFAERVEPSGERVFVHVTTKGRVQSLPDWTQIPEPDPLGACITIFAAGTVTSYRLCEVTAEERTNTPREAKPDAALLKPSAAPEGAATTGEDPAATPAAGADAASPPKKKMTQIAVYAPTSMSPDPPLEHCWAPKLDRLKGKYFFVNCDTKAKVWCLPEVTDLGSRVRSMFRRYAPAREAEVEEIVKSTPDAAKEDFIQKLVAQYGAEPSVIEARTRERLTAIFAWYDRTKLDNFEQLLVDNAGKEEQMIQALLKQYGAPAEPPTYRERLIALYDAYDKAKLPTVDETLRVYHGKELQFIVAVVRKLGPDKPEPLVPCKANKTPEELAMFRERARRMYLKYCRSRINSIESTLQTYAGIEELMMETLVRKYGCEPSPNEPLAEVTEEEQSPANQQPESPQFDSIPNASMMIPPVQGGEPMKVTPMEQAAAAGGTASPLGAADSAAAAAVAAAAPVGPPGMNYLSAEQQAQIQAQQQQSALSLVTDMEERLRGAYGRLEEAHQRAEALRAENVKLHDYSTKVMQESDVISQELRRQLAEAARLSDEIRAQCDAERERMQRENAIAAAAATQKLQEELLRGEQSKLEHRRELSELSARLCAAEEARGETTVQSQYLRQRVGALEAEMQEAAKKIEEMKYRLKERDDVCHRGVQTGGDDAELRTELKQRKTAALRELEALGAEAQHWRSLATRLEAELRAAERKRGEIERSSREEVERATAALQQSRDLNMALEDRVAVLEAELLATPSSTTGTVGETELRARVVELQRELTDAQATIRGQRQQVNDLRGLLAMHMASPANKGATSVLSPSRSATTTAAAAAASSPSASARRSPAAGGSTFRR